ncbi:hypothetical protein QC764_0036380 [Podospora pseudoanserina]|uniref:Uncharacterized protein n=1 Tax=Podospora pseudoanserina TaxID=2609844 RepID=A0ABR0IID4_9PEZI|nr:hypothetical protein QC764_0036380 [Podospora pseudoanserina]
MLSVSESVLITLFPKEQAARADRSWRRIRSSLHNLSMCRDIHIGSHQPPEQTDPRCLKAGAAADG